MSDVKNTAYLSNDGRYTIFQFGDDRLKIIAPYSLQSYEKVLQWDHGYIVVMAKYAHRASEIEEYIDLVPTLENLYYDVESFLNPIENVEVAYV